MAALGDVLALSGATVREVGPSGEYKQLIIELGTTTDNADTFTLDLTKYGCTRLSAIFGNEHSTDGSIVITQAPTTSVTTNTVTVTIGGSNANLTRTYVLWIR